MRGIAILGSTGSIGTQSLDVISRLPDRFRVVALAAGSRVELLAEQVIQFRPSMVSVQTAQSAVSLQQILTERMAGEVLPEIRYGEAGLMAVATHPEAAMVVTAVVGALGIRPTLAAVEAGKDIALANKETLVAAGSLVMTAAQEHKVTIIPVDSEHSALFQCLIGEDKSRVRKLILTASGGPFRGRKELSGVTREEALRHPRWVMGSKVTIDSATLMNKALEMIEAQWLFGLPMEQVEVLIHPQSIVHSAVAFVDGNLIAQLGPTDMRLPIQYALTFPERVVGCATPLDLAAIGSLTFEEPDPLTFPSLNYARQAATMGGTMPAVMNAANEVAVERFLAGQIPFAGIFVTVAAVMERHQVARATDLDTLFEADAWARRVALSLGGW